MEIGISPHTPVYNRGVLKYCFVLFAVTSFAAVPELRLPENVRPTHYALDLTLIPDRDTFTGQIEIEIEIRKPTETIWLNARNLTIESAKIIAGGHTEPAKVEPGGKEFVAFSTPSAIPAGKGMLQITYHGNVSKKASGGVFQQQESGEWYIYTQFEAIDARAAFPCFDEPGFKVPWNITLHVKKEHAALSNTAVASESDESNGMKKVVFAESKPLPSYLVAMAVGPFEFVDAGKFGSKHTPLRIVTPKGRRADARYAAEVTGPLLEQLEKYFGLPYAYDKLDSIAVPLFGGAMENPGLITYGETIILRDPARDTISRQRQYASIAAHEMAHLWFGDLVTTAWWDDIWLNEAFASWMSSKVLAQWKPEWNTKISEQDTRLGAMSDDALISARKIRQPIESNDDIENAFDSITYSKGEAVIGMFENWMGADEFQRGVRQYIRNYSFRNATAADFRDALSSVGNKAVGQAFATFLNQAGAPLVSINLKCDTGTGTTLHLTQRRALPLGSPGSTDQTWQVPVCIRYGDGESTQRECTLLTQPAMDWKLPAAKSCPSWVLGNADGTGYYRVLYEGDLLGRVLADRGSRLSPAERVATLGDVEALTSLGKLKEAEALALVPQFADDPVRQVVSSAAGIANGIRNHLVGSELWPNYTRFIDKSFGERARKLGWTAKAGEDADTRLLRKTIVPMEAVWGGDGQLASEGRKLAERWIADRNSVDAEIIGPALTVAARTGDQKFFKQLEDALKTTRDRNQREHILGALGSFRDPAIARAALDLIVTPEVDMREAAALLFGPLSAPETQELPFEFVRKNFDAIVKKIPAEDIFSLGAFLPHVGNGFCDEKGREEVQAFFEPKLGRFNGMPRNLANTLENIRLCAAYRAAQQSSVAEFLGKY